MTIIAAFGRNAVPMQARGWSRNAVSLAVLVFCGVFFPAIPVHADVKAGVDAWSRGDYPAAIREWKGPAEKGDADALFNLAQAYKAGRGVKQDLTKAEELYGQAAARGHLQASDNYGLLLFQRGERAKAMPYITAAADRGEPRAQYVLGLAYFNGENVPKDWVRAYALASLAQRASLPQAAIALAEMDKYVSLEDRQKGVALAGDLAARAEATRSRQVAAADLGSPGGLPWTKPGNAEPIRPFTPDVSTLTTAERAAADASRAAGTSQATAGADYTRPKPGVPPVAAIMAKPAPKPPSKPAPAKPVEAKPQPKPKPAPPAPPAAAVSGPWRIQLGAFAVRGNADALWNRVKGRPELAGHERIVLPTGRLTRLLAGGFASQSDASAACARLKGAGFACLPTRD